MVYLDDILICATTKEECAKGWHRLKELASQLGFEVKDTKCVAPCQRLVFLGVIIDILTNSVKLEETRRQKYAQIAREVAAAGQATGTVGRVQLASLVGKLNFAAPF